MTLEKAIPSIWGWMQETIAKHASEARRLNAYPFQRLRDCFSSSTFELARIVEMPGAVPRPPLRSLGLAEFAEFEDSDFAGITFNNTYFIKRAHAADESLHFHELVHVVQWQMLGPIPFLATYAQGLASHGYRTSPLEAMAYDLQARFDSNLGPIDVAVAVQQAFKI